MDQSQSQRAGLSGASAPIPTMRDLQQQLAQISLQFASVIERLDRMERATEELPKEADG